MAPMFSKREIEQILKEDHEQYDICLVLNSLVIEQNLKKEPDRRQILSKVVYAYGMYMKAYCEGFLGADKKLCIRLWGVCEDSGITVIQEELDNSVLMSICKVMIVHGVMPLNQPIKLIKSFFDFARICIFPFITCISECSNNSETPSYLEGTEETKRAASNVWNIELLGLPVGVLEDEVTIRFMNNECSIAMHYLHDESFRLTITSLEDENIKTVSVNLELEFDPELFAQHFEFFDSEKFAVAGKPVGLIEGETVIPALRTVPKAFVEKL